MMTTTNDPDAPSPNQGNIVTIEEKNDQHRWTEKSLGAISPPPNSSKPVGYTSRSDGEVVPVTQQPLKAEVVTSAFKEKTKKKKSDIDVRQRRREQMELL